MRHSPARAQTNSSRRDSLTESTCRRYLDNECTRRWKKTRSQFEKFVAKTIVGLMKDRIIYSRFTAISFFPTCIPVLVLPTIYPSKGCHISDFCPHLWHLAQTLVRQGFKCLLSQIFPNCVHICGTPLCFTVEHQPPT